MRRRGRQPDIENSEFTLLRAPKLTRMVQEALPNESPVGMSVLYVRTWVEQLKQKLSSERFFARSFFPLKIVFDLLGLNPEKDNLHDLLAGASGVWSHEAEFVQPLTKGSLMIAVIRIISQFEKLQRVRLQELEAVFKEMQDSPENGEEIPKNLAFINRFKKISPEKWVNLLGRYKVKAVDLCLVPEERELRPRTNEELNTIRVTLRDTEGRTRSLYYRFPADRESLGPEITNEVMTLLKSSGDIGKPVKHPFFELEVDLFDQPDAVNTGKDIQNPKKGVREAIANSASVGHCKLNARGVSLFFPHFSNNEDHGRKITNGLLHILQRECRPIEPATKVIDCRTRETPEGERVQELEVVSGFSFSAEEIAWHAGALKLFEQSAPDSTVTSKPSFVQFVGMAQGCLAESTTYLCVSAQKADLQLAFLPFLGENSTIAHLLKKLQAIRPEDWSQIDLATLTSSEVINEMTRITAFTNRDIKECKAGHGMISQLYVASDRISKSLFSWLFPKMHGKLQKGPAQISSVFPDDGPPVVFTTAIDQYASVGIAITNSSSKGKKSRQLTFRLRLEQEEIAQLRQQSTQEADIAAMALQQVEQQTRELRQTMIDLSFVLQLAHAKTPEEQQTLFTAYQKLAMATRTQQPPVAETVMPQPPAAETQLSGPPIIDTPPVNDDALPETGTTPTPKESALIVIPPAQTAVIVHPTLGLTSDETNK